jgi:hypothetical protein
MELYRLVFLTSLILSGAFSEFVTSTISNDGSSGNSALRRDFVQAMDIATGRMKDEATFLSGLSSLAVPAAQHPGYHQQQHQQQQQQPPEYVRNLEEYQSYAINLTDYALKYVGCSNIKTWSDDLAAESSVSVLRTDRFVVLRLCPKDSCSNYNQYGCLEKFGDYLIPMETYLQYMAETFFTQYQEYCETCYECMSAIDGDDGVNNNGGRRLNDDANYGDDAVAGDDAAAAADDYYNYYNDANGGGGCQYYAVCENYKAACSDYGNLASDLQDYFQCAEFNIGDNVGYLGPHCKSDGKTIGFGIYNDQYCNQYTADLLEMSSYIAVSDNDLEAYYSSNCISCLASVRLQGCFPCLTLHRSWYERWRRGFGRYSNELFSVSFRSVR